MKLTFQERVAAILQLKNPKWELVQQEYNRMLGDHRLSETEVAADFGYKSRATFKQSTAYKRVVTGIVRTWLRTQ